MDVAPKVLVKRVSEPPTRKGGVKVADVAALCEKLHERGEGRLSEPVRRRDGAAMSNVLVVAEQHEGHLRKSTLNALAAGQQLARRTGGQLKVALIGKGSPPRRRSSRSTARRCWSPRPTALEHYLAESFAPVVAALAREVGATYVGAAASAFGKDLLPRAAALAQGRHAPPT